MLQQQVREQSNHPQAQTARITPKHVAQTHQAPSINLMRVKIRHELGTWNGFPKSALLSVIPDSLHVR